MDIQGFIDRVGIADHEALAERLGTKKSTVDSWSSGVRYPKFEMIQKLLELGMTVEEVFGKPYPSSVESLKRQTSMWEFMESNLQNMMKDIRRFKQ